MNKIVELFRETDGINITQYITTQIHFIWRNKKYTILSLHSCFFLARSLLQLHVFFPPSNLLVFHSCSFTFPSSFPCCGDVPLEIAFRVSLQLLLCHSPLPCVFGWVCASTFLLVFLFFCFVVIWSVWVFLYLSLSFLLVSLFLCLSVCMSFSLFLIHSLTHSLITHSLHLSFLLFLNHSLITYSIPLPLPHSFIHS